MATMTPAGSPLIESTLPWWMYQAGTESSIWMDETLISLGITQATKRGRHTQPQTSDVLHGLIAGSDDVVLLHDRLWRVLVWPQVQAWPIGCKDQAPTERLNALAPTTMAIDPKGWRYYDKEIELMAEFGKLNLAAAWTKKDGPSPLATLKLEYLNHHNSEQLDRLIAKPSKIDISGCKNKSAIVELLASKSLPVPKVLEASTSKKKTKSSRTST